MCASLLAFLFTAHKLLKRAVSRLFMIDFFGVLLLSFCYVHTTPTSKNKMAIRQIDFYVILLTFKDYKIRWKVENNKYFGEVCLI